MASALAIFRYLRLPPDQAEICWFYASAFYMHERYQKKTVRRQTRTQATQQPQDSSASLPRPNRSISKRADYITNFYLVLFCPAGIHFQNLINRHFTFVNCLWGFKFFRRRLSDIIGYINHLIVRQP